MDVREYRRSPHAVRFSQAIGVCVRKTFPVHGLKWADVGREYIEVVKGDLQRLFVLDFNDQAMNRFVEHQMLTIFKEFRADCHRHFKKYSDPEEARANPPNALYELVERRGKPVDRVELFRETHVRAGTFVSQAAEDAHNQMLELQSQPTLEGSQPLSEDEICDQSTEKEIELQAKLHEALERIEVQDRNHQALASQVEAMKKMIEELTRAQQGPPHDP
ncbi:CACTA en-spm transposon protein [Cucumis melo var. makuwa]|uniref:CACTA en-spm transposon protein n=1 Tax=Cucumis melo var. makuwa TaxID=1194695 RepID=A0A5D3DBQ6_CUCMM|nr:CACTA en-spm transposon protein [Cucumis melo var. makuwa]